MCEVFIINAENTRHSVWIDNKWIIKISIKENRIEIRLVGLVK